MTRKTSAILAAFAVLAFLPLVSAADQAAPGKADVGASIYAKKCAMCHGKTGVAKKMATGSANLNDPAWQKTVSAKEIVATIAAGKGKMPGLEGKLAVDEMLAIAEYVLTLPAE